MKLAPGENCPVGTKLTIAVTGPVDLTALVLGDDGKVSGDADMVFFNQLQAPGAQLTGQRLELNLEKLRPGADQVALIASPADEGVRFGEIQTIELEVRWGSAVLEFEPQNLDQETALVLGTVYRRPGSWKFRAEGQGYSSGLAGVATDYGIEVDDEPVAEQALAADGADRSARRPGSSDAKPKAEKAPDLVKAPLGRINLQKSATAVIPLTKKDARTLRIKASLRWKGRKVGDSDLDFYALYIDDRGKEGAVYYKSKGAVSKAPWIKLDKDSKSAGEENLTIVAGRHPYVLLCAYSALGNGIGAFKSYNAHVVVDDGQGSVITVPLYNKNRFSYWVAIALIDGTDPAGVRVTQVEEYGKSMSEKRPVLSADGTFRMSVGKVEFKRR